MKKKPEVTFDQLKVALTVDLAKLHMNELSQLRKTKNLKELFRTSAFECALSTKTERLFYLFQDQEA